MTQRQTLITHTFEISVATAVFCLGVAYLIRPNAAALSPIGRYVGWWQYVWSSMYLVSAPMVIWGLHKRSLFARIPGLLLLATGQVLQGAAALTYRLDFRDLIYFIYAAAALIQAVRLLKVHR